MRCGVGVGRRGNVEEGGCSYCHVWWFGAQRVLIPNCWSWCQPYTTATYVTSTYCNANIINILQVYVKLQHFCQCQVLSSSVRVYLQCSSDSVWSAPLPSFFSSTNSTSCFKVPCGPVAMAASGGDIWTEGEVLLLRVRQCHSWWRTLRSWNAVVAFHYWGT